MAGGQVALYVVEPKDHTFQSASGANGNGTVLNLDGKYSSLLVQVVGATWTGTINFEATQDGTNYVAVQGTNKNSGSAVTTVTASALVQFAVNGVRKFRCRQSGFAAGTVTVTGTASPMAL